MNFAKTPAKTIAFRVCAGVSIVLIGTGLTGCSSEPNKPSSSASATVAAPPSSNTPAATAATPEPTAATASSAVATERKVGLSITGAKDSALVKALVVTSDGEESGGDMKRETLPFAQELTIPAGSDFTKILLMGKYADGATADISCSVSVDGQVVSSNSSTGHKPAECLVLENSNKN